MASPLQSGAAAPLANAIDIRVGPQRPIYRVASWTLAGPELQALTSHSARRWPEKVGTTTSLSASCRLLCIGPAEWLAIGCEPPLADPLSLAVMELTEGFARIDLLGKGDEELLMSVCGLDVSLAAFAPDTCARTRLAGIPAILDRHSAEEFVCYVPRSFFSYLSAALFDAANMRFK